MNEIEFLRNWAADNKCALDLEGEVGFGRECVGIAYGDTFVDLGPPKPHDFDGTTYYLPDVHPDAFPPDDVHHAYHKHDCLAVLGRGEDAIHELYLWVCTLDNLGFKVAIHPRYPSNAIDAALHGLTVPALVKA